MKVKDIKCMVERRPFRPFGVRLSNGEQYSFKEPRNVGAPRDYHFITYFGEDEVTSMDTDSIVEIIEPLRPRRGNRGTTKSKGKTW